MDSLIFSIWFHKVFGKSIRGRELLNVYKTPENLYEAIKCGEVSGRLPTEKISKTSLIDACEIAEICEEEGFTIIPETSPYYPPELSLIKNPPHVLFADGRKEVLAHSAKIAVVGTRDPSPGGADTAYKAAENLAKNSAVIVSGGAKGIDSAAHMGAVDAGGLTVSVLGSGLGNACTKRMGQMYGRIKENGVFITEMLPFENPSRFSFPERNRIISGISGAVLVIEAGIKSGALITADYACKQGKKLFALSSSVMKSEGTSRLIENGAYEFCCAGDIVYKMKDEFPPDKTDAAACSASVKGNALQGMRQAQLIKDNNRVIPQKKKAEALPSDMKGLCTECKAVLRALGDEILYADEICEKTELSPSAVMDALTDLELEDLIEVLPGNRVVKK